MIHAVIMAGGKGTRFWPLSRAKKPKQFLSLIGQKTMLDQTVERMGSLVNQETVWVVGSESQKPCFDDVEYSFLPSNLLLEPCGRNTAAAVGWAAFEIAKKDPDAVMVVLSADSWVNDNVLFRQAIEQAVDVVQAEDVLVTFGISPTSPHTGYGYIECGDALESGVFHVSDFKEKPDLQTAVSYLNQGNYLWNSGNFVWKTSTYLELLGTYLPNHVETFENMFLTKDLSLYETLEDISLDYAILEQAKERIRVIKAPYAWNDVGNWTALSDLLPQDRDGNTTQGTSYLGVRSSGNIIVGQSSKKLISTVDMHDVIIVDTEEALLVLPVESNQDIKVLYNQLPDEIR